MAKILNSKSERKAKPASEPEIFSLVSNEKLLAIYTAMIKCRMLEQRATLIFQQGKLASDLHQSSGREAASAAIVFDLQPDDALSIAPGDWLPAFVKGMALENLFRTLASPPSRLNGQPAPAPSDLEHKNILAVDEADRPDSVRERAMVAQAAKAGGVVAAILPSAEEALEPWHSILAAAASKRLPIVFVHHVMGTNQPSESAANRKAKSPDALFHGVPAIAVDGYDAVAVYRVAYEAIVRARQGRGATLLECFAHPGTSIHASENVGNSSAELRPTTDPVSSMENYLKRRGIEPKQHNLEMVATFNRDLELAIRFLDP
jgi:TPP-dependent pyruvate/acetoin dehydrogenase alpha subunit